jgi:putative FmdB family regulatory protein
MPTYDYRCDACKKKFSLVMTVSEHDTKRVRCPKCKSVRVTQQIQSFYAVTSSKS